jgi:hypothetical protein
MFLCKVVVKIFRHNRKLELNALKIFHKNVKFCENRCCFLELFHVYGELDERRKKPDGFKRRSIELQVCLKMEYKLRLTTYTVQDLLVQLDIYVKLVKKLLAFIKPSIHNR